MVHERAAAAVCVRRAKTEKYGESKRRIDSAGVERRYVSASDREDSPPGRSQPFSTKNDT